MKYYAGIGSRNTPKSVLDRFTKLSSYLETLGYSLRSGGALGADQAFENGCSVKEIFYANDCTSEALETVEKYHPCPWRLGDFARKLMGRNAMQILGQNLDSPVEFVVCWTPDGCQRHEDRQIRTGGTGQAISIASCNKIPVFNAYFDGWDRRLMDFLSQ